MKLRQIFWFLAVLVPATTRAQQYSVDWFKVAGGGGASSNGQYVVNGTIGQPDAGNALSGGVYSVTGGFWSFLGAVQMPGAPLLTVQLTAPGVVTISWPATATGFVLQENTVVAGGAWSDVTNAVGVVNGRNQVVVSPPFGNRYYRLNQ